MYKSIILVAVLFAFMATGCNLSPFQKLKSGLEYKIITGKGGKAIQNGNFIKVRVTQFYNDSLLASPFDTIAQVIMIDSMRIPPEYVSIFFKAKAGDSIITRISTDTIMKHNPMNPLPAFAKAHQFMGTRFRVLDVFTEQADAEKANEEARTAMMRADSIAMEKQKGIDDKAISDYLKKNNITAVKTPEGTYVEVINEGTGARADSGMAASVLYKGMLLNGKIFDQSYDSTGNPKDPFTFIVKQPGAIEGWSDGMVYFREGGKGRLFIPSARAYGARGAGQDIGPNTPIMFEIDIKKVQSQADFQKEMAAKQKQAEAENQQRQKDQQGQKK